jgi:hypothetical protein
LFRLEARIEANPLAALLLLRLVDRSFLSESISYFSVRPFHFTHLSLPPKFFSFPPDLRRRERRLKKRIAASHADILTPSTRGLNRFGRFS